MLRRTIVSSPVRCRKRGGTTIAGRRFFYRWGLKPASAVIAQQDGALRYIVLSSHDQVNKIFRPRRYRISAISYRHARADAFDLWNTYAAEMAA